MSLQRSQLEAFHSRMLELVTNTRTNRANAALNIRKTNRIIFFFTTIGAIVAGLTLYLFLQLTNAINHSIESMSKIRHQVVDVRGTMNAVTTSISSMGENVKYLQNIQLEVDQLSDKTGQIKQDLAEMQNQTSQLRQDAIYIQFHTAAMNYGFGNINRSMLNVSSALYETARPIRQFIPLP